MGPPLLLHRVPVPTPGPLTRGGYVLPAGDLRQQQLHGVRVLVAVALAFPLGKRPRVGRPEGCLPDLGPGRGVRGGSLDERRIGDSPPGSTGHPVAGRFPRGVGRTRLPRLTLCGFRGFRGLNGLHGLHDLSPPRGLPLPPTSTTAPAGARTRARACARDCRSRLPLGLRRSWRLGISHPDNRPIGIRPCLPTHQQSPRTAEPIGHRWRGVAPRDRRGTVGLGVGGELRRLP